MKEKSVEKIVWIIKLSMIAFGYLILSMLQQTLNPLEFHWFATIVFALWTFGWLKAKTIVHKDEENN